ncbi:MAG: sigma-70 family RNA polymerase sigma factor [Candidatus Caenarcaniphilales bacterium]|nr:sigma-70 family RNA polymerase sigma factor [Candidatus Caenarcaniphilales bacterium]
MVKEPEEEKESAFPSITPGSAQDREALITFIPLAEMVARKEMKKLPPYVADFKELTNIGLIKINFLIKEAAEKKQTYNPSYIAQAIVWEIRNKNRQEAHQRGEFRSTASHKQFQDDGFTLAEIREAVIETVVSYEESSFEIADENSIDPLEAVELAEMKKAIKEAIALLPDNYRQVIELRFYKGMKGIDIAERLGVSSTRVTRIIQDAVTLIKERLSEKRLL